MNGDIVCITPSSDQVHQE